MKATFKAPLNVIEAAVERAGLVSNPSGDKLGYDQNAVEISFSKTVPGLIKVIGTPNGIMRLIGALADDGQECLKSVS